MSAMVNTPRTGAPSSTSSRWTRSSDAEESAFWVYFNPIGHHSTGGNQLGSVYTGNTLSPPPAPGQTGIGVTDAGGQRNSVNRNTVLIAQIGSVEGAQAAAAIASHDLVQAIYLDEPDLASKARRKLHHPGERRESSREGQQQAPVPGGPNDDTAHDDLRLATVAVQERKPGVESLPTGRLADHARSKFEE